MDIATSAYTVLVTAFLYFFFHLFTFEDVELWVALLRGCFRISRELFEVTMIMIRFCNVEVDYWSRG